MEQLNSITEQQPSSWNSITEQQPSSWNSITEQQSLQLNSHNRITAITAITD